LNRSKENDQENNDNLIKIKRNYNVHKEKDNNLNETSNNFGYKNNDNNFGSKKFNNKTNESDNTFRYQETDQDYNKNNDYEKKLQYNYDFKKDRDEKSNKFNFLSELKDNFIDKKKTLDEDNNKFKDLHENNKKEHVVGKKEVNIIPKSIKKDLDEDSFNQDYNNKLTNEKFGRCNDKKRTNYEDSFENKQRIDDDNKNIFKYDYYNKKNDEFNNIRDKPNKNKNYKNYDEKSDNSSCVDNKEDTNSKTNQYSKYSNYDKYEDYNKDKNEINDRDYAKTGGFNSTRLSRMDIGSNDIEKYKFKSLEKRIEKNDENFDDENLIEENRKLINNNTSLNLRIKNLEVELGNTDKKYKKLESEMELAKEKLNDMENHYINILKEKDENLYDLKKRNSLLEKEDVKNINMRISLFKNLKIFFLTHMKYLKMPDDIKKE